eukprot:gene26406-31907_t
MALLQVVMAIVLSTLVCLVKKSFAEGASTMEDAYYDHQMSLLRAFNLPEGVRVVEEDIRSVSSYIRTTHVPPLPVEPGWVYGFAFSDAACSGTNDLATGLVTGKCLAPADSSNPVSYRITCNPASFTQISYSSANCDPTTISGQVTTPFTCIDVSSFSAQLQCSAQSTVDLGAEFILRQYYNDADCQSPLQFNGIRNGACLRRGHGRSIKYDYPTGTSFYTPDCTGPPGNTFTISETGNCSSEVGNYYGAQLLSFPYTSLDLKDKVTA